MEEKFDAEFKKKVKGINPEIPNVVRIRISDTLASLPEKKVFWKSGYLSAVAALFLVCFVGIRYIFPMELAKDSAPESAQNSTMAAAGELGDQNKQGETNSTMNAKTAEDKTFENDTSKGNTSNSANAMLKSAQTVQSAGSSDASTGTAPGITSDTSNMEISLTGNDGKTAADQGIQLILKTAIYDGKEIRIEFDKNSIKNIATAAGVKQEYSAATSVKPDSMLKNTQVNAVANYDVRVVVDNIPLKCSINVLETPQGENQYSGTIIIVPDSGLPEKFDMILNFDKIGEITGQWLLTTQVSKQ